MLDRNDHVGCSELVIFKNLKLLESDHMRVQNCLVKPSCYDQCLFLHHLVVQDESKLLQATFCSHHFERVWIAEVEVGDARFVNLVYRQFKIEHMGWTIIDIVDFIRRNDAIFEGQSF